MGSSPPVFELRFIFAYSVLIFFIVEIIALGYEGFGGNIGDLQTPTIPTEPNILDLIGFVLGNLGFFFSLMAIDTGILWLGIILFSPAIVTFIYILVKLIISIIP